MWFPPEKDLAGKGSVLLGCPLLEGNPQVGDFDTVQHEFYTDRRKQTRAEDIRLRVRHLETGEVDIRQGLPLTTVTRIVGDLLAERFDLGHISGMIADAVEQGLPIDWERIARDATEHAAAYGLGPDRLLAELATAAESPADTATTTLSMLDSHPELKRVLSNQLAESLETISEMMVLPHLPDVFQVAAREMSQLPVLPQLQGHIAAELAKQRLRIPFPDVSIPVDVSAFRISGTRSDRHSTRDRATDKDAPSTDES